MEEPIIKNYTVVYRPTTKWEKFKQKYLTKKFFGTLLMEVFTYVLILGIAFVIVYPLIRRIGNAFKPTAEFYDTSVVYFPKNPTLDIVKLAWRDMKVTEFGLPSLLFALYIAIAQVVSCTLVAYGLARFKFRGNKLIFLLVIFTLIVPPQAIKIPLYLNFRYFDVFNILKMVRGSELNLIDTYWCQILMSTFCIGWKNGLYIYMLRQYFRGIPKELEESAYIDGARTLRAFLQIILPSSVPMMFTVFLFSFSWQWTDTYLTGTFFLTKSTVATQITKIVYDNNEITQMNVQNTATLILIVPLILLFILTQRFFVEGVERSGLTG
ncbi:MAG: carbohydrate ABC transporter permease [Clostridiales bacterium]|nr:carbohydrate ABC transporter permease [Clostridiales bacterium]